MNIKDGLYLFPDGAKFSVCGVHLGGFSELGSGSAGELLIDLLDYDFSKVFSIVKNADAINGEEIFDMIEELGKSAAAPFLIKLMTERDWSRAFDASPENWGDGYKDTVLQTLNSIVSTHINIWEFADYYCERCGSAEERFDFFTLLRKSLQRYPLKR